MLRSFVAVIAILVAFSSMSYAQGVTTGTITGVVRDSTKTLQGATVKATNASTGAVYGAYTREDGQYTLRGLRPGNYIVRVTFVGYLAK